MEKHDRQQGGQFRPVVTIRDFFSIATYYAGPTAGIGQERAA